MKCVRTLVSLAVAISGSWAFAAKNLYVSTDKSYGADLVPADQLFDDIQVAVNAAAKGDTVWVKDGFVCNSGSTVITTGSRGEARISITKVIT